MLWQLFYVKHKLKNLNLKPLLAVLDADFTIRFSAWAHRGKYNAFICKKTKTTMVLLIADQIKRKFYYGRQK